MKNLTIDNFEDVLVSISTLIKVTPKNIQFELEEEDYAFIQKELRKKFDDAPATHVFSIGNKPIHDSEFTSLSFSLMGTNFYITKK